MRLYLDKTLKLCEARVERFESADFSFMTKQMLLFTVPNTYGYFVNILFCL